MNRNFGKLNLTGGIEYAPKSVWTTIHHHDEWDEEKFDAETGEPTGETEHKVEDWDERKYVLHPTAENYLNAEGGPYKVIVDERPPYMEGYTIVDDGWEDGEVFLTRKYSYEPIHRTEADFDAAMEEHIRKTREERGYTTREPSEYISSSVPRWAQDAADFVRFRDEVMVYGLAILNEWKATGIEPSYDEFVANLPKITWTEA